jgi:hypothetical protein
LLLLLPISLGWKSAIRIDYSSNLENELQNFLARNHFVVVASDEMFPGKAFTATRAACRMLLTGVSYRGWERDSIHGRATATEQVFIVYHGKVYAEQPTWLTAADFLWYKVLSELGLKVRRTPVIAVIAAKSCAAERLPWHELGSAGATGGAKYAQALSNCTRIFGTKCRYRGASAAEPGTERPSIGAIPI